MLFWWQLFNAWSGSNPIDGINLTIFNLVYTSLPIMVVGIADQDLPARTLLKEKFYYTQGRKSMLYTHWKFGLTVVDALYQSAAVFFLAYGVSISLTFCTYCVNLPLYTWSCVVHHIHCTLIRVPLYNHVYMLQIYFLLVIRIHVCTCETNRDPCNPTSFVLYILHTL